MAKLSYAESAVVIFVALIVAFIVYKKLLEGRI